VLVVGYSANLYLLPLTVNLIFVSGIRIQASSEETELVDANLFDKHKLNPLMRSDYYTYHLL
jgi:hypothetical protein